MSQAYTSNDLSGLTVEHNTEAFREGRDIVLTLKDKGQLRWQFCRWYRSIAVIVLVILVHIQYTNSGKPPREKTCINFVIESHP